MDAQARLEALRNGENPAVIAELRSGFAVMGENQFLPGYCIVLASPLVGQLNDLEDSARGRFLADMALLGDAVREVTRCKRVNYGIYGNVDPFLHAHVWPRYEWERAELSQLPPLTFPIEVRTDPKTAFSTELHGGMQSKIREWLLAR